MPQRESNENENKYFYYPTDNRIIEVKEEQNKPFLSSLKQLADKHNAILLTLIAPYIGKRISPVDVARARIGIEEEIGIETAAEITRGELGDLKKYNLFLLLETPGGDVDASYKIARFLAKTFKSITIFIAHEAASGGTLISFAGSKIKMGETAALSPIDIQTNYQGFYISVNMAASSLASIAKFFKTRRVEEVEYPYTALANKLDPIIYEDWTSKQWGMVQYAYDVLSLAGYPENQKITVIKNFIFTKNPHNFVILKERAANYKLNVAKDSELSAELACMRWWLNEYMFQKGAYHIIRFVLPSKSRVISNGLEKGKAQEQKVTEE